MDLHGWNSSRLMFRLVLFFGVALTPPAVAPLEAQRRPMTVDDLLAVRAVSDPQVSPDAGRTAAA